LSAFRGSIAFENASQSHSKQGYALRIRGTFPQAAIPSCSGLRTSHTDFSQSFISVDHLPSKGRDDPTTTAIHNEAIDLEH
jgi:hypothetical protein